MIVADTTAHRRSTRLAWSTPPGDIRAALIAEIASVSFGPRYRYMIIVGLHVGYRLASLSGPSASHRGRAQSRGDCARGMRLMVASLIIPTAARRPSSDRDRAQSNALEEFRNLPYNANSLAVEMIRELFFILASFLLSESAALQISVSTPVGWSSTQATATKIRMREPSPDERKAAKDALEAANAKLEALNAIGQAPKSWADLGTPQKLDREIEVPGFLNWLPGVIGTLSVITLLLNNAGVFGNGPSIDELNRMAEDFSNSVS